MKLLTLILFLSGCGLKPAPVCHLSLKDTPDLRQCERACKLATYSAEFRISRLGWCLEDLGASLAPAGCRDSYGAAREDLEWR